MDSMIQIILIVGGLLITMSAHFYIRYWYKKASKIEHKRNMTGKEVARLILDRNGLQHVTVEEQPGFLTDHYDPRSKTVRLSTANYNESNISAVSVAAHEVGHAIQDKENYYFLKLRSLIAPVVGFASYIGYFAVLIGIIATTFSTFLAQGVLLIKIGIAAELIVLLFQVITLPVEFDASKRALIKIQEEGIVDSEELRTSKKMLTSAALTYVAGVLTTLLEVIRLILIINNKE